MIFGRALSTVQGYPFMLSESFHFAARASAAVTLGIGLSSLYRKLNEDEIGEVTEVTPKASMSSSTE